MTAKQKPTCQVHVDLLFGALLCNLDHGLLVRLPSASLDVEYLRLIPVP